jgi:trigger factor
MRALDFDEQERRTMKIELSDVSPVKKNMAVSAGPDVIVTERKAVLRRYAKEAKVPGFRRGKVPLSVIEARFAKEVDEDVKERLVARLYTEAVKEKGLTPLGDPALEEVIYAENEPFSFKTSFEVLPEFELKKYKGVEARRPEVEVTDKEVDDSLEELRQAQTKLVSEEGRKASTGDVVVADVEGVPEDGEPYNREGVMLEIGGTSNLPEFNDALEGAGAGDELEFPVSYPEEYEHKPLAGKTVQYKMKIHEVKRKEVPELDDEFGSRTRSRCPTSWSRERSRTAWRRPCG